MSIIIIITDEDAKRLLSIPEAIEAMWIAFRDLSNGRAVNPPRLRYSAGTPDPARRYTANIHAGAVESAGVACVRAGSMSGQNDPMPSRVRIPISPGRVRSPNCRRFTCVPFLPQ